MGETKLALLSSLSPFALRTPLMFLVNARKGELVPGRDAVLLDNKGELDSP